MSSNRDCMVAEVVVSVSGLCPWRALAFATVEPASREDRRSESFMFAFLVPFTIEFIFNPLLNPVAPEKVGGTSETVGHVMQAIALNATVIV